MTKDTAARLLELINNHAMVIVGLPPEAREARYAEVRREFIEDGLQSGMSPAQAAENAGKLDEFIRAAVQIIETSGGGQATGVQ